MAESLQLEIGESSVNQTPRIHYPRKGRNDRGHRAFCGANVKAERITADLGKATCADCTFWEWRIYNPTTGRRIA